MSQVKPMGLVESMSGKLCGHSDLYFFRKNGKVFSGKICNPSTKDPSATLTPPLTFRLFAFIIAFLHFFCKIYFTNLHI